MEDNINLHQTNDLNTYESVDKKLIDKYNRLFKKATLMDDHKFRKVCESKDAIEEILQTILKDNKLKVVEVIKQSSEGSPVFHGVILDCKCRLKTKEIVNIEVQVALDDNPVYRMRYNGSVLTVENSPKAKKFKYNEIPKLILIMFCEFDLFKKGKPIYEIIRYVKDTSIISDNGIREVYVNLKAKASDKKLQSLFNIMMTVDDVDEKSFPVLSKKKEEINDLYIGGDQNMAGLDLVMYKDGLRIGKKAGKIEGIEEGMQKGIQKGILQGKIDTIVDLYKKNLITIDYASAELGMTEKEFIKLVNSLK